MILLRAMTKENEEAKYDAYTHTTICKWGVVVRSSSSVWECQPFFYLSDNVGNAGVKRGTTPFAYM